MKFNEDEENSFDWSGPTIVGAIFMSNRSTKKECLKRKLFGLPPAQANFVKKIKAGMPLFLFEYEERKLYGVFRASSDGAMNIVPGAFRSSGRQVPAQILFKTLWYCHPLSEHEFCDAIKDNYYTPKKFNLGLSEDQVFKLLLLFNSRKVKIQESQHLLSGGIIRQSGNSDLGRVRVSEEGRSITTDRAENQPSMDCEPLNSTKYSGIPRPPLNLSGDSEKLILETDYPLVEGQHRLSLSEPNSVEPEIPNLHFSTSHVDMCNKPVNTHYSPYPSKSPSFWYNHPYSVCMDQNTSAQELVDHSKSLVDGFFPFSRSQMNPSHIDPENLNISPVRRNGWDVNTNLGDYIPLTSLDHFEPSYTRNLFPEILYSQNKSIDSSNLECYKGLSFSDPTVVTMPSKDANFGSRFSSFAFSPGKSPSHVLDHGFSSLSKHEFGCEGPLYSNYEPSAATLSLSREDRSHLQVGIYPLDSRRLDIYERLGQDDPTNFDEDYRTHIGLHSDNQDKRTSVFSRLTVAHEATVQDDDEYLGNKYNMNMSVDQLMNVLYHSQNRGGKTRKKSERFIGRHDDGDFFENTAQIDMGENTAPASDEEKCSDRKTEEIPIVNFKRRSKIRKTQGETEVGVVEGEGFSGALRKKRKLVRPSFGNRESSCHKAIISESSPDVLATNSSQGINEDKGNSGSDKTFLRSDGDEGNGKESSYNEGVQNGISPVDSEGQGINEKTEENTNSEKGPSQDCSLSVQCSSQGTIGCEVDNGKSEEVLSKAPQELVDIPLKILVGGNPEGLYLESHTIQAGSYNKAEKGPSIEDLVVEEVLSQELVSSRDCSSKMQCSSHNEPVNCEIDCGKAEEGLGKASLEIVDISLKKSVSGNKEGLSPETHTTEDSNVDGLSQELISL